MNRKYVIGVCITVIVLTINQTFIQYSLRQKVDDAEIINISGKQRMLSQKINTLFYQNFFENDSTLLSTTFKQWKETHFDLKERYNVGRKRFDKNIYSKFSELDKNINYAENFLERNNITQKELNSLYVNQQEFLRKMDNIVNELQESADRKLSFIVFIEYLLFAISLLILILEVYLIYMPTSKRMKLNNMKLIMKNKELNEALNEVEVKNKKLEQYVYLASHDLQEPVKNIYALSDLLSSQIDTKKDEQTSELLKHIKLKTSKISNTIKELIDYHNVGTNQVFEEIDLNAIFSEIKTNLKDELEESNVIVEAKKLPSIVGLKEEIKILFFNIIGNALKFRDDNLQTELVLNFEEEENDFWCFWLESNNIRMNNESLKRVFQDINNPSKENSYSGIGISVALCEKIIKLHHGKSWIGTTVNDKTKFYFTISKKLGHNV